MFYLSESWNVSYRSVMEMPFSRRRRMIDRKLELEQKREQNRKAEEARARARARSGR